MSATIALRAHGLSKSYGSVLAVDALALEVSAGSVVGLLGPNGAGKTTAIRMLSTLLRPDAGEFWVAGVPHTQPAQVRRLLGVLPESAGYPCSQSGREWLTYHARLFGLSRRAARTKVGMLLAEVGLADRGPTLISTYSRGMRQRLGIARALLNDPRVVFFDEPTLGLDPSGQRQVLDLVARIAGERGVAVVVSTHLLDEVERSCDRVIILSGGRIASEGTVAQVAALDGSGRLSDAFRAVTERA